ncbi:hypothetical protein [Microcoleus sp. FACHB-68]|nr:hypothetical protein [Microcoleus sp. FACHB-68]
MNTASFELGNWAWGMGHWELGMGQGFANLKVGAWGMGCSMIVS